MERMLVLGAAVVLAVHGLIHLMGTTVYLKLGTIEGLPYKTTLLAGRWEVGERGIAAFGASWVVPALGFLAGALALAIGWAWWQPVVVIAALLSLVLTVLDWSVAYAGAIINAIIVLLMFLGPRSGVLG